MLLIFKELLLVEVNCLYFFNQGNRENCLYSSIACIRGFTVCKFVRIQISLTAMEKDKEEKV